MVINQEFFQRCQVRVWESGLVGLYFSLGANDIPASPTVCAPQPVSPLCCILIFLALSIYLDPKMTRIVFGQRSNDVLQKASGELKGIFSLFVASWLVGGGKKLQSSGFGLCVCPSNQTQSISLGG